MVIAVVAVVVSVAGCVDMPSSGPVGAISASPQSTAPAGGVIQTFPSGPQPGESPSQIVGGFLAASANYPFNAGIARQYLVSSAVKTWSPTWSVTVYRTFAPAVTPSPRPGARQTTVVASGSVQSTFNGTGQFVSAGGTAVGGRPTFRLTKVNGQWRIANPPSQRLLTVSEFNEFYKPQDLYFLNGASLPGVTQPLVPDSVFVPQGTSTTDLLNNLVNALLPSAGLPKSTLLKAAARTFPPGTTLINVAQAGTTAVVNLGGLAHAGTTALEQVSAQLAWTLASPRPGPGAPIQSVELERNGQPFTPPKEICGIKQARSQVQNQATYPCYNPFPAQPANFSFTSEGQLWSRCAAEASVQRGQVGPVFSVLGAGAASLLSCRDSDVLAGSTKAPVHQATPDIGTPSLVAVSPDGVNVACYSPDVKKLFTGLTSGGAAKLSPAKVIGPGVTALSWDRSNDLWVAVNGDVFMVPVNGQTTAVNTPGLSGNVTDLSVAPDGTRIALIVQNGSGSVVDLAAIIHGAQSAQPGLGAPSAAVPLSRPAVRLGQDLAQPEDLTWYDADNLIVLTGGSSLKLSEVPVDGQDSFNPQLAPPGIESITADSEMNALVAGLAGQQLAVSTSIEGPWQLLGVHGQNPAYPG